MSPQAHVHLEPQTLFANRVSADVIRGSLEMRPYRISTVPKSDDSVLVGETGAPGGEGAYWDDVSASQGWRDRLGWPSLGRLPGGARLPTC